MVRTSIRRLLASSTTDAIIRIVVVLSLPLSGFAAWQGRELSRCVATYNNANNTRSVILTEATNDERAAERHADDAQAALFLSPALSKPSSQRTAAEQAEILRLFRAYQTALSDQKTERAAADDARVDHPIPDPPSEVCG
jgi:hypothetical protein